MRGVTVEAVDGDVKIYGALVDQVQSNVSVTDDKISGTSYRTLVDWLESDYSRGYFLALRFKDIDPNAISVRAGFDSYEENVGGLLEMIDDRYFEDKNGLFLLPFDESTPRNERPPFKVVTTDGERTVTQEFDLSDLRLEENRPTG